jgi:predicted AlkP superfamily phosphohydrolase/phosphomutase
MEDPEDGSRIVEKVFKKEEIYHGQYTENAPDLFVLPYMTYHNVGGLSDSLVKAGWKIDDRKTSFFLSKIKRHLPTLSGNHRMEGVFIITGSNVKKGKRTNAEIIDLAPTILYSMSAPVPKDMDGKVLKNIFSESFLNANPVLHKDAS